MYIYMCVCVCVCVVEIGKWSNNNGAGCKGARMVILCI